MKENTRYPLGIHTFAKIRQGNYLYVDKTALIYEMTSKYSYVFLSRPRRFGKSLLVSTIESYFKGDRELFEGLAISRLEANWDSHPVFRFDLSPTAYSDINKVFARIDGCLKAIEKEYGLKSDADIISERFLDLIQQAYEKYGKGVVILIDEYDKPLLDCLGETDLQEKIRAELRGFYSVIKASDEYLKFVMITGISKFGKVNIFGGMNNLKDISMLDSYNSVCGISESEFRRDFHSSIRNFSNGSGISEEKAWEEFREMYDGYHFSLEGEGIYNPFSVMNAFDEDALGSFWYESGSSDFLVKLVEHHSYRLDSIDGARRTKAQLNDINTYTFDIVPMLYQSGYLTIKGYDSSTLEYTLGFPNHEVYKAFWESMVSHYFRLLGGGNAFDLKKCLGDLYSGNPESFMLRMQGLLADSVIRTRKDKEVHFQNMMATVAKMLGLEVRTEVTSSAGRCDMQILTPSYIYIFEFKVNGSPEEALQQIHEKGYCYPYAADPRKIFLIGANFSTKTRTLTTPWLIETYRR